MADPLPRSTPVGRRAPRRAVGPAIVPFVLLVVVQCCWALALPRNAGPDESSHDRKAAATVRGQLVGPPIAGYPDGVRRVVVPAAITGRFYPCFAFAGNTTAACQERVATGGLIASGTTAGKYPPLPYLPAGLTGLLAHGYRMAYAMRIGQAVATAALVAWALAVLARRGRPPLVRAGLLLALTPTAVFLSSVVNPNGIEAAAAVLAWSAGFALVFDGDEPHPPDLVALAAGASVLALTRTLSPLWLAVLAATVLAVAPAGRRRALVRGRAARRAASVVAVAVLAQLGWIAWSGLAHAVDPAVARHDPGAVLARLLAGRAWLLYRQVVGQFGWYEVNAPALTLASWTAALSLFVGAALLVARRRVAAALIGLVVVYLAVPTLVDGVEASRAGVVWQGRYSLPLAAGITILSGFALAGRRLPADVSRRLVTVVGVAFVTAQVSGYLWAVRRYMVGVDGPVWFWRAAGGWRPAVPLGPLLVVQPVALAMFAWTVLRTRTGADGAGWPSAVAATGEDEGVLPTPLALEAAEAATAEPADPARPTAEPARPTAEPARPTAEPARPTAEGRA